MTLKGILGVFRVAALDSVGATLAGGQDLASLLARPFGFDKRAVLAALALAFSLALLAFVFKAREFRTFDNVLGGVVVGLVVVGGWVLSGHIGYIAEDPATLEEKSSPPTPAAWSRSPSSRRRPTFSSSFSCGATRAA